VETPFLIRKHGPGPLSEPELAGYVWRGLEAAGKEPSVDLKAPLTRVHLFFVEDEAVVTILRWENDERFFDRRSHLRPRNHPTGLNPKLARAMVNLAGKEHDISSILDPFCGGGGILLEGGLAGREMTGVDIDPEQVKRSEEKLAFYHVTATLTVSDATQCDSLGRFDAIVTDLPYGKNSRLDDGMATFARFFEAAAAVTEKLVVSCNESAHIESLLGSRWEPVASFLWYIHRGLSKRILLLERR
jgi:tRNA (guanine10-N2)-dimethyltransferase